MTFQTLFQVADRPVRAIIYAALILVGLLGTLTANAHCKRQHDPDLHGGVCLHDDSGSGDDGSGDIATNDIFARWSGAIVFAGTGGPRDCQVDKPQPKGTHTPYACTQSSDYPITVNLTGGVVLDGEDVNNTCNDGFAFTHYPNAQYIVAAGGGEVCADEDGCPLTVHNVINHQIEGWDHLKIVGTGRTNFASTDLNPFAAIGCDKTPPDDQSTIATPIERIEVRLRNGKGSKAQLVCLWEETPGTYMHVTPICP